MKYVLLIFALISIGSPTLSLGKEKKLNREDKKPSKKPQSIGVAKMEDDGTIIMTMNIGMTLLKYPKGHPEYEEILKHLGGLRPGESKPIPPWPER